MVLAIAERNFVKHRTDSSTCPRLAQASVPIRGSAIAKSEYEGIRFFASPSEATASISLSTYIFDTGGGRKDWFYRRHEYPRRPLSDVPATRPMRDVHVRVDGPVVSQILDFV